MPNSVRGGDGCDGLRPAAASRVKTVIDFDIETYPEAGERAALRAGLSTAATICDLVADKIRQQHVRRGRVTKEGLALAAIAKLCGDEIMAARFRVHVPRESGSRSAATSTPKAT